MLNFLKSFYLPGLLVVLFGLSFGDLQGKSRATPDQVAVVYNTVFPGSEDIARYYAKRRGIPEENLIGLACSKDEHIPRQVYIDEIADPLRRIFSERQFWRGTETTLTSNKIRYIVTVRGIPLSIKTKRGPAAKGEKRDPIKSRDEASLDSELALLGVTSPSDGFVENPYFERSAPFSETINLPGMMLVTRLDGPSTAIVKRIIDETLEAEREGLWGWAMVDLRGIKSGAYKLGDEWLRAAALEMQAAGIPVIFDAAGATFPAGFPVENLAVYYGWYKSSINGPFASGDIRFAPGAIALHIHSFSATRIRDTKAYWVGPLLARGASAVIGNVYEPYLKLTVHPQIMQNRLMSGMNYADSAYAATPVLSWMTVIIGDPLYRPYGKTVDTSLSIERPKNIWSRYQMIVYAHRKNILTAADDLKILADEYKSPVPFEGLAWVQLWNGDTQGALASIDEALKYKTSRSENFRLRYVRARIFVALGKKDDAIKTLSSLLKGRLTPSSKKLGETLLSSLQQKPKPKPKPEKS
ncbi:MAG: TIGR03790 family protein [Chthoniobacterales bacterium]